MGPIPPAEDRPLSRSAELFEQARDLIPGAPQTGSKSPSQFVPGVAPSHLKRGGISYVWGVD